MINKIINFFKKLFKKELTKTQKSNLRRRKSYGNNWIYKVRKYKPILLKKNNKCFWCGKKLKYKTATIDHKIPLSQGGTHKLKNLRLIHNHCRIERDKMITKGKIKCEFLISDK